MTDAIERMRASKQAYEVQQKQEGHDAGIAFATNTAEYEDLLIFRKVTDIYNAAYNADLLAMLGTEYGNRWDYNEKESKEHLFGDADAEPSGDFVGSFFRAALETLEAIAEQADTTPPA